MESWVPTLKRHAKNILATLTRLVSPARRRLESTDSAALGRTTYAVGHAISSVTSTRVPWLWRTVVEMTQPEDPLAGESSLPEIDIVIPCHSKDFHALAVVIEGVQSSRNPIRDIQLIAPSGSLEELAVSFPHARIRSDDEVLGEELTRVIHDLVPPGRRGWALQQAIKLLAALENDVPGSLIMDADTVLLRSRAWLSEGGEQALSLSHSFYKPYVVHAERMWGSAVRTTGFSYVTHYQLMQRAVLEGMFPRGRDDLMQWLRLADWRRESAASEYHSYGAWLNANQPERVRLAKWANRSWPSSFLRQVSPEPAVALAELKARFPDIQSVSFHSYLS